MVQIKNLKQRGLLLAGMICAGVIFLAQVFTKGDPYQIYVTQGRSYLTYMHSNFYDLPANLFFSLRLPEHDGINTLFFIFFFALSYIGIKHKLFSDRKILPVVVFCTEFLVIDVFLSQTLNIYHFTFLAIPVLLSLCLISTTLPGKKGLLAIVCFLLFFIPLTLRNYALILTNEIAIPKICTGIQKTANIPIITDYFSYDAITYCLGNKKSDIRLVESKDILITRTLSEKEILFAQGRNFGVAPLMLQTYKSIGKTLQPLKEYLTKNPDAPKRFAYIKFTVNFAYLFPDEILTFQDYHLQDSYFPGIYIFEKQH
jgi:hypothetical protein